MLPTTASREPKEALSQRLEAIGWGLFLIIIGMIWIAPAGLVPDGTWLIAAGAIMLGVNVARYLNSIKMSGTSLILGALAIVFGVGGFAGIKLPLVPILLIVFGLGTILRPWIDPLLERKRA